MDADKPGGMTSQRIKKQQVSDALREIIAPLLPPEPPKPDGGRPRIPDRQALGGILLVLRTGMGWQEITTAMGFGSGTGALWAACWRRLRDWQAVGVWERLHRILLDQLGDADKLDWGRVSGDSASVAAKRGAHSPGRIRRIAANRARSAGARWAALRQTDAASRSRSR